MKINRKSVSKLPKKQSKQFHNFNDQKVRFVTDSGSILALSCEFLNPNLLSEDFPTYAYIPYNKNWGIKEEIHKIKIMTTQEGLGVVKKDQTNQELSTAIQNCLGEKNLWEEKQEDITFRFLPHSEEWMIDKNSFTFAKNKLEVTTAKTVGLSVPIFVSPEGQNWVQERKYMEYASAQEAIYECSDGSLVSSYQQFRDWEKELAFHPQNPEIIPYLESDKTLSSIGYLEFSKDGTVWRNQILLEEYLHWLEDEEYGSKDGFYVGFYGICSSFEEYVRINNAAYFINQGLKREEQFLGANGFLYSSSRKACQSLEGIKKYQSSNVKKIKNYS